MQQTCLPAAVPVALAAGIVLDTGSRSIKPARREMGWEGGDRKEREGGKGKRNPPRSNPNDSPLAARHETQPPPRHSHSSVADEHPGDCWPCRSNRKLPRPLWGSRSPFQPRSLPFPAAGAGTPRHAASFTQPANNLLQLTGLAATRILHKYISCALANGTVQNSPCTTIWLLPRYFC